MAHAQPESPPRLVAVGGMMGSGKSHVALRLARLLGAQVLSTDEVRREFAERGVTDALAPGFASALYPEVLARAAAWLRRGRTVVVDGTFRRRSLRADARRMAQAAGATFLFLECRVPVELARERMRERDDPGWEAMLEAFLAGWEPVVELRPEEHVVLDTSGPVEALDALHFDPDGTLRWPGATPGPGPGVRGAG